MYRSFSFTCIHCTIPSDGLPNSPFIQVCPTLCPHSLPFLLIEKAGKQIPPLHSAGMWLIKDAGPRSSDAENNNNSHQKSSSDCDLLLDDRRKGCSHFSPQIPALNPERHSLYSCWQWGLRAQQKWAVWTPLWNPAVKKSAIACVWSYALGILSLTQNGVMPSHVPQHTWSLPSHSFTGSTSHQPEKRVGLRTETAFHRNHGATCILIQTLRADAAGPASPSGTFPGLILFQTHFQENKGNDNHGFACSYNIYNFFRAFCPRSRWCPKACLA